MKTAILLIGHGSRVPEANQALHSVSASVRQRSGYGIVEVCFREQHAPNIQAGIDRCVARGAQRILLYPYFLYAGAHVLEDLPAEMVMAAGRYPGLEMTMGQPLGVHRKLGEIVCERIGEAIAAAGWGKNAGEAAPFTSAGQPDIIEPSAIEARSFTLIDEEAGAHGFGPQEWPVVRRIIHTTADFDFLQMTHFSPDAVAAGVKALREGVAVCCDTNMVLAGVNKARLAAFGSAIGCHVADADVTAAAKAAGVTRSTLAMRKGVATGCGIYLIGNAPTALFELLRLAREGTVRPALVVGVPVGFVGAAESKEALLASGLPFITCRGRKGGSAIAAAILNALLLMAEETR
jgi:precorrin-8X/cobalt-precorrin-8 methylmutase